MDKIKFGFYILKEHLYKSGDQKENGNFRLIYKIGNRTHVSSRLWYRSASIMQKMVGGVIVLNDKNIWL